MDGMSYLRMFFGIAFVGGVVAGVTGAGITYGGYKFFNNYEISCQKKINDVSKNFDD